MTSITVSSLSGPSRAQAFPRPDGDLTQYMQDALEAAHQKDRAGKESEAIRTYRISDQIIDEALKLDVPSVGLGPAFSNTARWRADLTAWKAQAADRSA